MFASPGRCLQGPGLLDRIGRDLIGLGIGHAALLMSARRTRAEGARILASPRAAGIAGTPVRCEGESSLEAIAAHLDEIEALTTPVDGLIAVGGGKAIDTGTSVAYCRLHHPAG